MQYIPPENYDVINKLLKTYSILKLNRGVEIGVRHGFFTEFLLINNPHLDMICVDSYLPYNDLGYEFTKEEQNEIKYKARVRLEPFNHRAKWSYLSSIAAANCFDDEFFDFVFIDGIHDFVHALQDLKSWEKKVRKGGILSGHDASMSEVKEAVMKFVTENILISNLYFSPPDEGDCFWIVM